MINHGYKFFVFIPFLMLFLNNVEANHGPGTGGGATTIPALTLKSGAFSVGLRTELTEFESISNPKLLRKAEEAGAFDVIDRTFLHTVDIGYGITDDLTIGLGIGWFEAVNFREGEFEDDEVEVLQANPDGITDLWLSGKYRFWRGPQGHYAIIGGIRCSGRWASRIRSSRSWGWAASRSVWGLALAVAGLPVYAWLRSRRTAPP